MSFENESLKEKAQCLISRLESNFLNFGLSLVKENSNLEENLNNQLIYIKKSKLFVCFLNKNYAKSDYCKIEFQYASRMHKKIYVFRIENEVCVEDLDEDKYLLNSTIKCFDISIDWFKEEKVIDTIFDHIDKYLKVTLIFYIFVLPRVRFHRANAIK